MITSFFKKKGEAAADAPAPASASSVPRPVKRPIDEALGEGASKTDASPSEPTAGAKAGRRRKATIHDSDDEDGAGNAADTTPVPPLPPLPEVSISGTRVAPINTTSEPTSMEMDEAAPSMMATAALAQTDAKSELAAKAAQPAAAAGLSADAKVPAATAAKKAPVAAAAIKAQKAAEAENKADSDEDMDDEEVEDEAEDEEDGEEGEDVDAAGASSSGKARLSHSKVSKGKPVGTTAAKIAYNKYDVEAAATWKAGEPVPYLFLARVFGRIEAEPKRLLITELMANAFRTVIATSPDDLLPLMSLATNKLAPAYEGIELGIGDSIMIKAVSETCGRSVAAIKADMEEVGDLGEVAMASRTKQVTLSKPKPLQVRGVYKTLKEIALTSGHEAMKRKGDKIKQMLVAAQEKEAQYIVRSLQGKMRIGLAEQTALVSLAHAFVLTASPGRDAPAALRGEALQERLVEAEAIVKQVYSEMPNYELIIKALLAHGIDELPQHARLTAGVPVKPMLAKPTKGLSEVLDRFSNCAFTCEYKYDGERAQIHLLEGGMVKVYSRNSEDNTTKYPDIAALMPRAIKSHVTSIILDSEAVAVDTKTGAILPFQVLSTRKRKDASVDDIGVKVCVFAFDLLYLNGESYLQKPLAERRAALHASLHVLPRDFEFAQASDAADVDAIQEFLLESIKGNCEGLMIKTLAENATYEPSRRSLNWLKVKKDYLAGMTDSCDLVPIGAYYGKGKRTGVYGAYLLACYNPDDETYESVCKIGTGFNDEALQTLHKGLSERIIQQKRAYYKTPNWADSSQPDVWFEPCQVWEVLAADLSISPVHMAAAGLVDPAKGIALRFPRFLRVRDDKGVEDATSAEQIAEMYNNQACTKTSSTLEGGDDY